MTPGNGVDLSPWRRYLQNPLFRASRALPPHTIIQPHSHPDDRSCFVLSGLWYFGYGDVRDETKLQALPPGSAYTEPGAKRSHFAGTKDAEAIVECTAMGPTDTYYVDPKKRSPKCKKTNRCAQRSA